MDTSTYAHALRRRITARRAVFLGCVLGMAAVEWMVAARAPTREYAALNSVVIPAAAAQTSMGGPASFADVVDRVKSAVIGVRSKAADTIGQGDATDGFSREFGQDEVPGMRRMPNIPGMPGHPGSRRLLTSLGSGFFITADGYAVTNNHVVEGSDTVEVQTDDQKTYTANVVGADAASDIALLKADGGSSFAHVKLANTLPRVGDWILAIGNPFGLGGTVTAGIVSARERDLGASFEQELIQIDAPINKGDSGGPSFDLAGNVIGVNTMIVSPTGGSIGIAFAIPADTVRMVVDQLRQKGKVTRGWMGVQIQPVTADIAESLGLSRVHGAIVAEAAPGSPSAKAGLASGDVVVSVNGEPTKDARDLSRKISGLAPGSTVKLGVMRKNAERTISVTLAERPSRPKPTGLGLERQNLEQRRSGNDPSNLGLQLAPSSGARADATGGVVITDVDPNGRAADSGLEAGDVILDVSGRSVRTPSDVHGAFRDARKQGKRRVLVRLKSGDRLRFIAVAVDPV